MTDQPSLIEDVLHKSWVAPKHRGRCTRDLTLGPGSCFYWWENCPRGEWRGCYALWAKARNEEMRDDR